MSGVGDGTEVRAGGGVFDEVDPDLRRGEGGYNGGTVPVAAGGEADGAGGVSAVMRMVEMLERRIRELEKQVREEGGNKGIEFVNVKQMTPAVLKEGVAFRTWREEFERWTGIKVDGMQEMLKWLGGQEELTEDVDERVKRMQEQHGLKGKEKEIGRQLRVALET